jgi:hypothetical protein
LLKLQEDAGEAPPVTVTGDKGHLIPAAPRG